MLLLSMFCTVDYFHDSVFSPFLSNPNDYLFCVNIYIIMQMLWFCDVKPRHTLIVTGVSDRKQLSKDLNDQTYGFNF